MSDASRIARGPGEMMGNAGPGMLAGLRVIELAAQLVEIGNKNAVSDVGTAAASALAGFQAACLNVEINLQAVKDVEWRAATERAVDGVPGVEDLAARVLQRTQQRIRGEVA